MFYSFTVGKLITHQVLSIKNLSSAKITYFKRTTWSISQIFSSNSSHKKLGTRDSVLLVGFRVQGGQSLFFCEGGKSPRTVGFAECTIPLSGHMRIQQDSSVSSQGSTRPQVRDSRPTL